MTDTPEADSSMTQHDTLTLDQIVDNYLSDYELCGEDSEGRDAIHAPSETETFLIKDAILGLLEDDDFKAWNRRAALSAIQQAQAAQGAPGYFRREIGEDSDWRRCTHEQYLAAQDDPHIDTRVDERGSEVDSVALMQEIGQKRGKPRCF